MSKHLICRFALSLDNYGWPVAVYLFFTGSIWAELVPASQLSSSCRSLIRKKTWLLSERHFPIFIYYIISRSSLMVFSTILQDPYVYKIIGQDLSTIGKSCSNFFFESDSCLCRVVVCDRHSGCNHPRSARWRSQVRCWEHYLLIISHVLSHMLSFNFTRVPKDKIGFSQSANTSQGEARGIELPRKDLLFLS